jgi:hypothetical protein
MLQTNIFTNPVTMTILVLGVLGLGFMVRFLIAMAAELGRPRTLPHGNRTEYQERLYGEARVNPVGSLAVGVARITRAMSANSNRGDWLVAGDRPMLNVRARKRTRGSSF